MRRRMYPWAALCLGFSLAGCELVFQAGPGLSGQAREDYLKSIKPYLHYWEKPGMSLEGRRDDSYDCGGSRSDTDPIFRKAEEEYMLPGETIRQTRSRVGFAWASCMKGKGYRYYRDNK